MKAALRVLGQVVISLGGGKIRSDQLCIILNYHTLRGPCFSNLTAFAVLDCKKLAYAALSLLVPFFILNAIKCRVLDLLSNFYHRTVSPRASQRTETPDLVVNILAAMFMDANSWNSNFAA